MKQRLLSIGECMVELTDLTLMSQNKGFSLNKGFAGDTFNMAFYARLALPQDWAVDYYTALGTDVLSAEMRDFMAHHNIGTSYILEQEGSLPGLYLVHVHEGERSFSYWRSQSAARQLASEPAHLKQALDDASVVIFSGITVAILPPQDRAPFLAAVREVKNSGREVVFDPNIRLRLWDDLDQARVLLTQAAQCATLIMPSFEDEALCFGDSNPAQTIARYRALGLDHIVVKQGAEGITLLRAGEKHFLPASPVAHVVDTTSAGDSFNGTYLARLLAGDDPLTAARFAADVASFVIGQKGAIVAHPLKPS